MTINIFSFSILQQWLLKFCGVMFFMALGSFFNVIVSRNNWHRGRSRCDSCASVLVWHELIPLLSYTIQKGRCRHCGASIDSSHIVAELFALFGGIALVIAGFDLVAMTAVTALLFNAIMDCKTGFVSTIVTYVGAFVVAIYKVYQYLNSDLLIGYLLLMSLTAVVLHILAKSFKNYVGGGDFDVFFLLILSLGYYGFVCCLLYASAAGITYAVFKKLSRKARIPLVPFLYIGYLIVLFSQGGVLRVW